MNHYQCSVLSDSRSPKSQAKKVNYFSLNSATKKFPKFLKRYEPTDVVHHSKHPVGRPNKNPQTTLQTSEESQQTSDKKLTVSKRSAYRAYSLRQKLEIVCYACQNSEAADFACLSWSLPLSCRTMKVSPTCGSHSILWA